MPPYQRDINTVFQDYALFPHMTIFQNVAFGLRAKHLPYREVRARVTEALELIKLAHYHDRTIQGLSGGEQQRVALARAFVNRPTVLLLDEPLGALDLKLRREMQVELKSLQKALGIAFVYVTHDQEEALSMSDSVIIMNQGHIEQEGAPLAIYNDPSTAFVANFLGEANILPGASPASSTPTPHAPGSRWPAARSCAPASLRATSAPARICFCRSGLRTCSWGPAPTGQRIVSTRR